MAEELLPCPHCGKPADLEDEDTLYPSGTGWRDDKEEGIRTYHSHREVPKEQWCWGMHCPTTAGGCGAEIHGDSREEALAKWNRRAELQKAAPEPVAWMREWEGDISDLGHMIFETNKADLDNNPNWIPLYEAAPPAQEKDAAIPRILFDGYAVLQALTDRAKTRTSGANVADTLDAVVKIMRADAAMAAEGGE